MIDLGLNGYAFENTDCLKDLGLCVSSSLTWGELPRRELESSQLAFCPESEPVLYYLPNRKMLMTDTWEQNVSATYVTTAATLSPKSPLKREKRRYLVIDTFLTLKCASHKSPFPIVYRGPLRPLILSSCQARSNRSKDLAGTKIAKRSYWELVFPYMNKY